MTDIFQRLSEQVLQRFSIVTPLRGVHFASTAPTNLTPPAALRQLASPLATRANTAHSSHPPSRLPNALVAGPDPMSAPLPTLRQMERAAQTTTGQIMSRSQARAPSPDTLPEEGTPPHDDARATPSIDLVEVTETPTPMPTDMMDDAYEMPSAPAEPQAMPITPQRASEPVASSTIHEDDARVMPSAPGEPQAMPITPQRASEPIAPSTIHEDDAHVMPSAPAEPLAMPITPQHASEPVASSTIHEDDARVMPSAPGEPQAMPIAPQHASEPVASSTIHEDDAYEMPSALAEPQAMPIAPQRASEPVAPSIVREDDARVMPSALAEPQAMPIAPQRASEPVAPSITHEDDAHVMPSAPGEPQAMPIAPQVKGIAPQSLPTQNQRAKSSSTSPSPIAVAAAFEQPASVTPTQQLPAALPSGQPEQGAEAQPPAPQVVPHLSQASALGRLDKPMAARPGSDALTESRQIADEGEKPLQPLIAPLPTEDAHPIMPRLAPIKPTGVPAIGRSAPDTTDAVTVRLTIGRVEVRQEAPPTPKAPVRRATRRTLSLDDYLTPTARGRA